MRIYSRCVSCLVLGICTAVSFAENTAIVFGESSKIEFLDVGTAAKRLGTSDVFTKSTGPLERQFRLQSAAAVSEQQMLTFAADQAVAWEENEIEMLSQIANALGERMSAENLILGFPPSIEFIKTTGKEEGGAAYCRGNAVIFSAKMLMVPPKQLKRLVAHELFHILSRSNPVIRDELFRVIGFERCSTITLPANLRPKRLTNPDAPRLEHFISLNHDGESVDVIPITFLSTDNFEEGNMFTFLQFKLLVVERPAASTDVQTEQAVRESQFLTADNASFQKKIGKNTNYIIHPEEIMADNFAIMLTERKPEVPDPWIVDKMRTILQRDSHELNRAKKTDEACEATSAIECI